MIIIDTNILLRAALNDNPSQAMIARQTMADAEGIVLPLHALCEFVWVLARSYKLAAENIVSAVRNLIDDARVSCDRQAIEAGVAFLEAGGDFADGVIEFEGRRRGGTTFVTFDREAASLVRSSGRRCLLLRA